MLLLLLVLLLVLLLKVTFGLVVVTPARSEVWGVGSRFLLELGKCRQKGEEGGRDGDGSNQS